MGSFINPLTGRNERGFREGAYNAKAEKQACREILQKGLPDGYTIASFRYKPLFGPGDTNVELTVTTPTGTDTHIVRVPIDNEGRTWGGRIPNLLRRWLKKRYA